MIVSGGTGMTNIFSIISKLISANAEDVIVFKGKFKLYGKSNDCFYYFELINLCQNCIFLINIVKLFFGLQERLLLSVE